jgi:hypothetical protein
MPEYYEIKIKGKLDSQWSDWFSSLIFGQQLDKVALYGLLDPIRDLNLNLISVTRKVEK